MLYRHCFSLYLKICHQESPRKLGRIGIEWNTSAPAYTDDINNILSENVNIKHRNSVRYYYGSSSGGKYKEDEVYGCVSSPKVRINSQFRNC
jgi:hypothetical protein